MSLAFLRTLNTEYRFYRKELDANLTIVARYALEHEWAQNLAPCTKHQERARHGRP